MFIRRRSSIAAVVLISTFALTYPIAERTFFDPSVERIEVIRRCVLPDGLSFRACRKSARRPVETRSGIDNAGVGGCHEKSFVRRRTSDYPALDKRAWFGRVGIGFARKLAAVLLTLG